MGRGRPKAVLELSAQEREELERWVRRPKSAQALALRARIVLRCADGLANFVVAEELGLTEQTVGKWRRRFVDRRVEGLLDEPRPGAPRRVSDEAVERAVVRTLESKPQDATHWSTRSLAQACGLSQSTVFRIWRAFGLQPHRTDTFKLSRDPLFIEKVRDIVGLYLNPPDRALVLCVDEKSQIQALDRTQPAQPPNWGANFWPNAVGKHHRPPRTNPITQACHRFWRPNPADLIGSPARNIAQPAGRTLMRKPTDRQKVNRRLNGRPS